MEVRSECRWMDCPGYNFEIQIGKDLRFSQEESVVNKRTRGTKGSTLIFITLQIYDIHI